MQQNTVPAREAGDTPIELLELPREFDGSRQAFDSDPIRLSLELARARRGALTVVELENPSTTMFALFL